MVKFADGGIMEKGKVSTLFKTLYFTAASFFTTFTTVLVGGKYLSKAEPK